MNHRAEIPKHVLDKIKNSAETKSIQDLSFPEKLYFYDGTREANGVISGFNSNEDFLSSVLENNNTEIFISLFPSTILNTDKGYVDAKYEKNVVNYNQRKDDLPSLIYGQKRPKFVIREQLDIQNKFILVSRETLNTDSNIVPTDIDIFVIDNYDEKYDDNGVFDHAIITLEKVASYLTRNKTSDGSDITYKFIFTLGSAQPLNASKLKLTFFSRPIIWGLEIKDNADQEIDFNITEETINDWNFDVFLPTRDGNKLRFTPAWSIERTFIEFGIAKNNTNLSFKQVYDSRLDVSGYRDEGGNYEEGTIYYTKGDPTGEGKRPKYLFFASAEEQPELPTHKQTGNVWDGPRYNVFKTEWDSFLEVGGAPDNQEWENYVFEKSKSILNNILPFSSTGLKNVITDKNLVSDNSLPRKENQQNALWLTFKNESIMFLDIVYVARRIKDAFIFRTTTACLYSSGINNQKFKNDMIYFGGKALPSWIGDYTPFVGSDREKEVKQERLKGITTWMGETIDSYVPDVINDSFDFSPAVVDWNKTELKKHLGLYPNKLLNIDSSQLEEEARGISISKTTELQWGIDGTNRFSLGYKNFETLKSYKMRQDFYKNENGEYVLELEWEGEFQIQSFLMKYFGGYQYLMEWFDANGNYAKYIGFDGIEHELGPQLKIADNRKGNPRQTITNQVYGASPTLNEILLDDYKEKVESNAKWVINPQTGKKEKNKLFRKNLL